jgi:hypothetical protein
MLAALAAKSPYFLIIARWLMTARGSKRGEGPLCLACEREFGLGRRQPEAFCVAQPYYRPEPESVIVTGICRRCAGHSDDELMAIAGKGIMGKDASPMDEHQAGAFP